MPTPLYPDEATKLTMRALTKKILNDIYTDEEGDHVYRYIKALMLNLHVIYVQEKQSEYPVLPADLKHIANIESQIDELMRECDEYAASRPHPGMPKPVYVCMTCLQPDA